MSFLLLDINLLLKFDFLLKYEAYPIKWTSDTWCFAGLYLPCRSFQRLRWSTAVWCRWRKLKPVHVIRKVLWKTESVMIGKIVTFWRVKMQIWEIYGILLELWTLLWMRPILHCFLWEPMAQEWHRKERESFGNATKIHRQAAYSITSDVFMKDAGKCYQVAGWVIGQRHINSTTHLTGALTVAGRFRYGINWKVFTDWT